MKHITIEQARNALHDMNNPLLNARDQDIAAFMMEEFVNQQEHFIRTREIMVPILLQPKKE